MKHINALSIRFIFACFLGFAAIAQAETPEQVLNETHDELIIMVNINLDDAEKMATVLQGIGPARADAIVAYREEHGPFLTVDELLNIRGIGERTLAAIRHQLQVGVVEETL